MQPATATLLGQAIWTPFERVVMRPCKLKASVLSKRFSFYFDEDASCVYFVWNVAMNEARFCSGTAPDFQAGTLFS